jgi:hypothetical protein
MDPVGFAIRDGVREKRTPEAETEARNAASL